MEMMKGMGMDVGKIEGGDGKMLVSGVLGERVGGVRGGRMEVYEREGWVGGGKGGGMGGGM